MENNAKIMAADVVRKYKQLESTRLAALHDGDRLAYNKARAQQDILADLLDKWDVSIEDAGIDYTRLAPDMPSGGVQGCNPCIDSPRLRNLTDRLRFIKWGRGIAASVPTCWPVCL